MLYDPVMISVTPLEERRRCITEAREHPVSTEYVYLQGRYQTLPVVELPLSLPLYRAGNGRLAVLEAEYVMKHNLEPGYFTAEEESDDVQQVLHNMLLVVLADERDRAVEVRIAHAGHGDQEVAF